VNDRAVLGDTIDEVQVTGYSLQFVEDAPSDQQHDDAPRAGGGNRPAHRWVQDVGASDGPVVVQRDHRQLHKSRAGLHDSIVGVKRTFPADGESSAAVPVRFGGGPRRPPVHHLLFMAPSRGKATLADARQRAELITRRR
jgi:hypothetical protein